MSLSVLPPLLGDMANSLNSAERIFALLDRRPKINSRGGLTLPSIEGRIELRDVTLTYQGSLDSKALDRVNLTAEPGEHVCICGPTGAGKSTVLAVILRFFDPHEGLALLDDTDVTTFDPQWLRQLIGFLPQHPMLFTRSVEANIAFGQQGTRQQVERAAKLAGLHDTIMSLPDRYRTVVGTHPDTLARAFRQKMCIARAALKDPRILLLDEPLVGLSPADVAEVSSSLRALCTGRTVISVAHRAEVLEGADSVVVMRRGQVVEMGTPRGLAGAKGGLFATMRGGGGGGTVGGGLTSDDFDEEEELGGGGGGHGGRGGDRGGGGNRALQLMNDIEHEVELCKPKEGEALNSVRAEIKAIKRAVGRAKGHTI